MKPARDSRYLAWIRTLPCAVCGPTRGIEVSHTGPDRLGPREFAKTHNVDVPATVRRLNTKPVIRVEAGAFVGYLEQRQYRLGPTKERILPAVSKMVRLCAEDRGNTQAPS